ncbi:hypothetical protein CPAR01_12590 [Colletotrichum paranaense]|uniref:Uncharacterized protein n=2 Tax=Colletotrichum acutatum species complex TaxID=2707335 RepID=A0AAI9URH4_9PEZI|nr:uncharacterized protein CPAR01_12590 [Colletotrichum paranaense]KAK1463349.1 hypothetical protein CMEL01_13418 [Colletotrichum melonis]KAK1528032.1 hypothetical protein CPAR01_12590 [Colletotrichum paranaense]
MVTRVSNLKAGPKAQGKHRTVSNNNPVHNHLHSAPSPSSTSGLKHRNYKTNPSSATSSNQKRYKGKPEGIPKTQASKRPSSLTPALGNSTSRSLEPENIANQDKRLVLDPMPSSHDGYDSTSQEALPAWEPAQPRHPSPYFNFSLALPYQDPSPWIPAIQLHRGVLSLEICQQDSTNPYMPVNTVYDSSCSGTIITYSAALRIGLFVFPKPPSGFENIRTPHGYFYPEMFVKVSAQVCWPKRISCGIWNIAVVPDDFKRPEGAELIVGAKTIEAMKTAGVDDGLCDAVDVQQKRLCVYPWSHSVPFSSEKGELCSLAKRVFRLMEVVPGPMSSTEPLQHVGDPNFLCPDPYPPDQLSASSTHSGVQSYPSTEVAPKTVTSKTSFSAGPPNQLPEHSMQGPGVSPGHDMSSFNASAKRKERETYEDSFGHVDSSLAQNGCSIDPRQATLRNRSAYHGSSDTSFRSGGGLQPGLQSSPGSLSGSVMTIDPSLPVFQKSSAFSVACAGDTFAGQPWPGDCDEGQQPG